MSHAEFTERCKQALAARAPSARLTRLDDGRLEFEPHEGQTWTFRTANAYREYLAGPSNDDRFIARYVERLIALTVEAARDYEADDIVPLVRRCADIEIADRAEKADTDVTPVHESYAGDLCIIFGIDRNGVISWLDGGHLRRTGAALADVKASAIANLRKRISEAEVGTGNGFFLVSTHDGYTSSLLLLDEFWDTSRMPVQGSYLVFPVSRDTIAVTGTRSAARDDVAARARAAFDEEPYPITPAGFERVGKGWIPWNDPRR